MPGSNASQTASADPGVDKLGRAPGEVTIEGRTYRFEMRLSEDSQPTVIDPVTKARRNGMTVVIRLTSADGKALPNGLRLAEAWVIKGPGEVWRTELTPEVGIRYSDAIEALGHDGPRWHGGVDVVVRVRLSGQEWLARQTNVPMG